MVKRANPELVRYIERHLSKGFKLKHVKKRLAEVGHPIEAIEDAALFVIQKKPHLHKKPKTFMIVYGMILILAIAGFAGFIWLKAGQQAQYKDEVKEIEEKQSYLSMTEVELLKLAAATNDLNACEFVKDHNRYYACVDRYWERDDCSWNDLIGEGIGECYFKRALAENSSALCIKVRPDSVRLNCTYIIERGKTYEEVSEEEAKRLREEYNQHMKGELEQVRAFYPGLNDQNDGIRDAYADQAMAMCYENWIPSAGCVLMAKERGELDRLFELYKKENVYENGKLWSLIFDILPFLEENTDCSQLPRSTSHLSDLDDDEFNRQMQDLCRAIASNDNHDCGRFESDPVNQACQYLTKKNIDECGQDHACRFFLTPLALGGWGE